MPPITTSRGEQLLHVDITALYLRKTTSLQFALPSIANSRSLVVNQYNNDAFHIAPIPNGVRLTRTIMRGPVDDQAPTLIPFVDIHHVDTSLVMTSRIPEDITPRRSDWDALANVVLVLEVPSQKTIIALRPQLRAQLTAETGLRHTEQYFLLRPDRDFPDIPTRLVAWRARVRKANVTVSKPSPDQKGLFTTELRDVIFELDPTSRDTTRLVPKVPDGMRCSTRLVLTLDGKKLWVRTESNEAVPLSDIKSLSITFIRQVEGTAIPILEVKHGSDP
jgi:hypothetical protein